MASKEEKEKFKQKFKEEKEKLKIARKVSRKAFEDKQKDYKAKVKAYKRKLKTTPPKPTFTTASGLNCWIRYTNAGARYTTCGTYHGAPPKPPPATFTPLITPSAFITKLGKKSYGDLTEGQKREYHRLAMANTRAQARENIEANTEEYKKFIEQKREDIIEERRQREVLKETEKAERKIKKDFETKGVAARTEEDIKKYYDVFEKQELRKYGGISQKQRQAEREKEKLVKGFKTKIDSQATDDDGVRFYLKEIGEGGQYKPKAGGIARNFFEPVRQLPTGKKFRDLEDPENDILSPWGMEYSPQDIMSEGKTNMNFLLSWSLGGEHQKYAKKKMKDILWEAWDEFVDGLSPAEKKALDPNDEDLMESLTDDFEENMDKAWAKSEFGGNPDRMSKETKDKAKDRQDKLIKLAGTTYRKELTENYKSTLENMDKTIKKAYDEGEGRIKAVYAEKVSNAKSRLRDIRELARQAGIPREWVIKNVRLNFGSDGEPDVDENHWKKMINKIGSAQKRIQKLDDDVIEIQKAVREMRQKASKGTTFSAKIEADLYKDIEKAERHIKKYIKEQKALNWSLSGSNSKDLAKKRKELRDLEKQLKKIASGK
tara:strand:- start:2747 stop:4552 length:1806 start_codon:yes stop_codon:yes gene_type:complete